MKVVCCDCHKEKKKNSHWSSSSWPQRKKKDEHGSNLWWLSQRGQMTSRKKDNEPTKFKTNLEQLKQFANKAHFRNKSLVLHIYWGRETKDRANLLVLMMECDVDKWGQRHCCKHEQKPQQRAWTFAKVRTFVHKTSLMCEWWLKNVRLLA
jgi:hypothetical protein